jgi:hypothetical protein
MDSYVILTNYHRTETSLMSEDAWNDAIASGKSVLTHDTNDDLMYVVKYFDATTWDEARVIYDAWANETIWSE